MSNVAVVTGASAGVGRATARALAAAGYDMGLLARGRTGLDAAAKEVAERGRRATVVPTDVADAAAVDAAATTVEDQLGPIDVWVNNAMTSVFAPFTEISDDEYRRVTEVTYLGAVHGTHAALRRMVPRNRGVIVQVGSALAYRGIPLQSAYCGAKHAIQGFSEALRCELLHERSAVRLTVVHLPGLNTPQFDWVLSRLPGRPQPVPPIYQPEVAARAVLWAAEHPNRREYWVGGSTVATLLANKVAPGLLDRYLARTGFEGQQAEDEPEGAPPSNLWEPVSVDAGAHGRFGEEAHLRSAAAWVGRHRRSVTSTALVLAAAAGTGWRRRRSV
ncbi:MAG TPA: SDR family oxidoreductase [Acidimicrobiales bacterium]|nr:SDR family oxidoreductase [Acidimicrobiales bacterium]